MTPFLLASLGDLKLPHAPNAQEALIRDQLSLFSGRVRIISTLAWRLGYLFVHQAHTLLPVTVLNRIQARLTSKPLHQLARLWH